MTEQLTTQQAAEMLGVSIFTVVTYIKTGLLPAQKVNTHEGKGHTKYLIDLANIKTILIMRQEGASSFKPGPKTDNAKGKTLMYFPRPAQWGQYIKSVLAGEERAKILEYFANKKKTDPDGFKKDLESIYFFCQKFQTRLRTTSREREAGAASVYVRIQTGRRNAQSYSQ